MQQQSPAAAGAGAVSGSSGKLFEGLAGTAAASVFGSPPPAAVPAAGPFGGGASGGAADQAATAPVFGLQVSWFGNIMEGSEG